MHKEINCIVVDDEAVAREILESHLNKIKGIRLAASCKNAMEAFSAINTQNIDLIFLDINMPGIDGLSFVRSITQEIKVIFTTAYRDYAVDGFDLKAVDYLLKPISFERLLQAISKFMDESRQKISETKKHPESQDIFYVRSERKMVKIRTGEILYIESVGDYIRIHTKEKAIVTRETMAAIEGKLPSDQFLRTHRSFLVSVGAIDSFTNEYTEISGHQVPLSRGYRDQVLRRLEKI